MTVELYDTTLRDGAQMEGISLSVEDKLRIARKLDELGVHFIEGGFPAANPKDVEFFERMRDVKLNAKLVAFGSTRRAGADAGEGPDAERPRHRRHRVRHDRRQGARPAGARGPRDQPRREPRDARRLRALPQAEGQGRLLRRRALLRRLRRRPGLRARPACAPPSTPASTASCSATPTAAR